MEKNLPKELVAIVAPLYSCLNDRSGDVRKKAQAVVPLMMQHVGWDAMSKQANKLKVRFLGLHYFTNYRYIREQKATSEMFFIVQIFLRIT